MWTVVVCIYVDKVCLYLRYITEMVHAQLTNECWFYRQPPMVNLYLYDVWGGIAMRRNKKKSFSATQHTGFFGMIPN